MASEAVKKKKQSERTIDYNFDQPLVLTPTQDLKGYIVRNVGQCALFLITCTSVVAVFLIFLFIIKESIPFILKGNIVEFFTSKEWFPEADNPKFGALSFIVGSLYVTVGAMLFAVPIGLLAALCLSDILPFKLRQVVKPVMEILAGIPSVAYGFFAVLVVAPWLQNNLGLPTGANALNASIILAVMAIPTITSVAEDALSSVGREIREASYGLGATRAETLLKVVVPAAHSGIIAAIMLGMMRAIGETMVVWMASGNAKQIPSPWWNITESVRTMTATIAGEMGETPKDTMHYYSLFLIGVVLLVFTFVLNSVSEYFMSQVKKANRGK